MRGPYRKRRIENPPRFTQFRPSGVPKKKLDSVALTIGEYEAIRLADHENMDHQTAAKKMKISRPTFSRIVEKARSKVASAIIEGKQIVIAGGNIDFVNAMHRCRDCGQYTITPINVEMIDCEDCGSENLEDLTGQKEHGNCHRKGTNGKGRSRGSGSNKNKTGNPI